MTTRDQRRHFDPDDALFEALLRDFYAGEMPAGVDGDKRRDVRIAPGSTAGPAAARARHPSGMLGLTAAAGSLALALWAFAPGLSRPSGREPAATSAGHANRGEATAIEGVDTPEGPVELRGIERAGDPVRLNPDTGAEVDRQFPELEIRIIPIREDDSP